MFNPVDGATFLACTFLWSFGGLITGNSPVLAAFVGAVVTGVFVVLAKLLELWWKDRKESGKQKNSQA